MNISAEEILQKLNLKGLNGMQQAVVDASLKYPDIVLLSPTGSGKTLAYLIPLLQKIDERIDDVQALVIVPSRELAQQTHEVIKQIRTKIRSMACYGGHAAMDEHRVMKGLCPQIIIGTPGRLLDHITKENFKTELVKFLVIDEFDKSLELGFQEEMSNIINSLPRVKSHFLLSATDCPQIPEFVGTSSKVKKIDYTKEQEVGNRIKIHIVKSELKDKLEILSKLLRCLGQQQSLIFVGFRESVERIAVYLHKEGFAVSAYHGGMEQKDRERELFRFSGGSTNILVSTDLAARGLDIPILDNVIHYHLPLDEQAYIHRNGRTARWEANGDSYVILGPEEEVPQYIGEDTEEWVCPTNLPSIAKPIWMTLYVGKGKKDKISKGDIAGFLMKVGEMKKDEVGRIDVRDHYSYVSILRHRAKEVLLRVRGQKIKNIKTIIEPTR